MEVLRLNEQFRSGISAKLYRPPKQADVKRIAEAAFEVLEKSGIVVYSDTALGAFKTTGALVEAGTRKVVRMAEMIVGGADALRARPFVSFITLVISPFKIDQKYGEILCYIAREGLPIVVPTEPICGARCSACLSIALNLCGAYASWNWGVVVETDTNCFLASESGSQA